MARQAGYSHSEEVKAKISQSMVSARRARPPINAEYHRSKIKLGTIINCLGEHVEGKRDMSATQIQAALGLLRKTLPDLASVEMKSTGATTTIIVTGVVRAEDLERSSPSLPEMKDVTPK